MLPVYILPGFNTHNKDWADQCHRILPGSVAVYWQHWQTGQPAPDWIDQETQKIITQAGGNNINILAKSIGTLVACNLVAKIPNQVNHLLLCGVPLNDLKDGNEKYYQSLKNYPTYKFLCMQNDKDPHGKYQAVKDLFATINPELEIAMTTRPDHEYPYFNEFVNFFE